MINQDDWESHWAEYAETASINSAQQMRHNLVFKILRRVTGHKLIRLIDIGSGQGDLLKMLTSKMPNAKLLGLELSEAGVDISKRKVPKAKFIKVNLFSPPEELNAYEKWATHATCSEVLEHVDDPIAFLKQAKQYLADNALIIVTVPGGQMSAFDRHIGHRRHFKSQDIRDTLDQAGFKVENVYRAGFPFFNLYRFIVIMRGEKLIDDVKTERSTFSTVASNILMQLFKVLFLFNLDNSPFGSQIVAVAHNQRRHE